MSAYHIITFGCQMNISDSERISYLLNKIGYKPAKNEKSADLVVINSCSVRQTAIDRIWGRRRQFEKLKKEKKNFKTILTGCVLPADKRKFKEMFDFVLDIKDFPKLPELLSNRISKNTREVFFQTSYSKLEKRLLRKLSELRRAWSRPKGESSERDSSGRFSLEKPNHGSEKGVFQASKNLKAASSAINFKAKTNDYFSIPQNFTSKFSAYIPIMTGCNNFCAYCAVPYTRGKEISRPAKKILNEVKEFIEKGGKEVWLLGQNVNSYRDKIKNQNIKTYKNKSIIDFASLLRLVNEIEGDFWIRFTSPHPKDFSDNLIEALKECEKAAKYLNLPVQAGDNKILKKMRRNYTREDYLRLVGKIRKEIPELALSTDVIVGFPGETKKQFMNSAKLLKKVKFDMAFIAAFSPRPGTEAAKMKDNISKEEKEKRWLFLNKILAKTALEHNKKLLGTIQRVLVDEKKDKKIFGKTSGLKNVEIIGGKPKIGQFIEVKVTEAKSFGLKGEHCAS